jgi:glycosyltransferase involved in cell wall biosynthesis
MHEVAQPDSLDVSVVIPVYGGEKTIGDLARGIIEVLAAEGLTHELIFVCDRPRDDSWRVARALAREHASVRAIRLLRNFGQHPATLAGLRAARGRWLVTMDEDLQHDPRDVPALLARAREIGGIAYGTFPEPRHSLWRNLTSRLTKAFLRRYVGSGIADRATAFRAFPADLRRAFDQYAGERVAIDVLLSWSGAPFDGVACAHAPRAEGHSGYTFRKLAAYLGDLVVGYSIAPLRWASAVGLLAFVLAAGLVVYVLAVRFAYGQVVPGFAFVAISVAMLSGAQLLALGIIGEYLGRLYFASLGKPQYVIAEVEEGDDGGRDDR